MPSTVCRGFSDQADVEAMASLACAFPDVNLHAIDLPYRFSSGALDDPANVVLWTTPAGELLAWAVMQAPFWAIDHACHHSADATLRRQLVVWADTRARALMGSPGGRPAWFVNLFADQVDLIRDFEEVGFTCQADARKGSWSKVWMRRSAQAPVECHALPPGFSIRPLAGNAEVDAYVDLHRAVFESDCMTVEWRARTLHRPEYRPDLDLVAVAPDGRLVAFCIGWLDERSAGAPRGQIEPMGVRADVRRLGLGRAIISEALRRLVLHDAAQLFVETDSYRDGAFALYESVGFRVTREVLVFRKDYGE
jgi:ribosomal protein S18 acetylase RimI-like enzyme